MEKVTVKTATDKITRIDVMVGRFFWKRVKVVSNRNQKTESSRTLALSGTINLQIHRTFTTDSREIRAAWD